MPDKPYRLVILSDQHEGDVAGLTNPAEVKTEYKELASILFKWWIAKIEEIGPVDHILHLGETCEGPGHKSTLELYETDTIKQAEGAAEKLLMWKCPQYSLCYASKYHTSDDAKNERDVVKSLLLAGRRADIKVTQKLDIRGVKINGRHKIGGSSTGYGGASQAAKTAVTDFVRSVVKGYEPADWYFRGHVHEYWHVENAGFNVVVNPALKWPVGEYGVNLDRPYYDMGFTQLDVWDKETVDFHRHDLRIRLPEDVYAEFA